MDVLTRLRAQAERRLSTLVGGGWRLERLIGVGVLGGLYLASDGELGSATLRVLHEELAERESFRDAFVETACTANAVPHSDAVPVLEHGTTDGGLPFLVHEFLLGERVSRLMARRAARVPPSEALRITADALDVVHAAHKNGIVHGRLSPAQLFITNNGTVKVLNFGSALLREETAHVLGLQDQLGEAAYLAGECAQGEPPTEQSDIWAMGAVLFSLLTAQPPRPGDNDGQQLVNAAMAPAQSLSKAAPDAPPKLVELLERALASDPALRFGSAIAMAQAIRDTARSSEVSSLRSLLLGPESSRELKTRDSRVVVRTKGPAQGHADTVAAMPAIKPPRR